MIDPTQFGQPPPDAVNDGDAFAQAMSSVEDPMAMESDAPSPNFQPPMGFLEAATDIPRVEDANPFKNPDGTQKLTPREPMMPSDGPAPMDYEALEMAMMGDQQQENDASESYQAEQVNLNEQAEKERGSF